MLHPERRDGQRIGIIISTPNGDTFVDPVRVLGEGGYLIHRSGPEHPLHHHRFEDYGLADGLVRCRKCGLVKKEGA